LAEGAFYSFGADMASERASGATGAPFRARAATATTARGAGTGRFPAGARFARRAGRVATSPVDATATATTAAGNDQA
jgi:hypothetical protein